MKPTLGFGVYDSKLDEINIKTVSNTETAAEVNGLCLYFDIMPRNNWPHSKIHEAWTTMVIGTGASLKIVAVTVTPTQLD